LFLKVSLYFPLIFLHCFSVHRAPCTVHAYVSCLYMCCIRMLFYVF
jgi:hypothetical protein